MRAHTIVLLDRDQVHRLAAEHLQAHLQFKDYKRKTSAPRPLVAVTGRSPPESPRCPDASANGSGDAPSDETAQRGALGHLCPTTPNCTVLGQLNAAWLAGHSAWDAPQATPTAGHRPDPHPLSRPALPQPRTRSLPAVRPRTAPVISTPTPPPTSSVQVDNWCCYTVALTGVKKWRAPSRTWSNASPLRQAASVGIRTRLNCLLDRGFYSVAVIRYLQQLRATRS